MQPSEAERLAEHLLQIAKAGQRPEIERYRLPIAAEFALADAARAADELQSIEQLVARRRDSFTGAMAALANTLQDLPPGNELPPDH